MFAYLVRLALAAEIAGWFMLGSWIQSRHGWGAPVLVAGAVAGSVTVRLAIVCLSFGLSWRARSPRAAGEVLDLAGTVAVVAGEWRAMLANNYLWLPFEHQVLRPDPRPGASAGVPVVLVHGYFSNRGTVCGLARALDAAGIGPVFVPSLPAVLAPIETFAAHLDGVVRGVIEATGQPQVILVGHSMGGLIARSYLQAHGADRVTGLVTIGTPHHGTALAPLGSGQNARQMRLGSDFLRGLEKSEGGQGPVGAALSIYTVHDNLVAPQDSSRLDWARNASIHGVGHVAMLLDGRVHRLVRDELVRLGAGTGG